MLSFYPNDIIEHACYFDHGSFQIPERSSWLLRQGISKTTMREAMHRKIRDALKRMPRNPFACEGIKREASALLDLALKLHWRRVMKRRGIRVPTGQAWNEKRIAVQRDGGRCRYCGKEVGSDFHVDHVIPRAYGGSGHHTNLVTACIACNLKKGGRTPVEAGMSLILIAERDLVLA